MQANFLMNDMEQQLQASQFALSKRFSRIGLSINHAKANLPRWADAFAYVNGGLFSGSVDVPRFSKTAFLPATH